MKEILIVGAGGIGSYAVEYIYKLIMNGQMANLSFTIVDDDIVEEKNVKYQNYRKEDILKSKVKVLDKRYKMFGENKRIETEKDLERYDAFIIAVDNSKTRRLIYEYCYNKKKFFLDLRAEGRQIAIITSDLPKAEALDSLPKQEIQNGSCQLKYEFEEKKWIQQGNIVVAAFGSQVLLNKLRGEKYNPKLIIRI